MGIEAKWKNRGIRVGKLPCGPLDKISDVPGVTVGHCTLADGEVQTGVTALLPHQGDIFHDKVMAASHVINGFGKTTGLVQIDELDAGNAHPLHQYPQRRYCGDSAGEVYAG